MRPFFYLSIKACHFRQICLIYFLMLNCMLQIEMNIFQSIKLSKLFYFYAYKILNRYVNSRNLIIAYKKEAHYVKNCLKSNKVNQHFLCVITSFILILFLNNALLFWKCYNMTRRAKLCLRLGCDQTFNILFNFMCPYLLS